MHHTTNREDAVDPGRPFELFFKSGDMNDVLKSLTMIDLSDVSGKAGGASTSSSFPRQPGQSLRRQLLTS